MKIPGVLLLACVLCAATYAQVDHPPSTSKMRLFLASGFDEVWDDIVDLLPFEPEGSLACHVTTAAFDADWTQTVTDKIQKSGFEVNRIDIALYKPENIAEPFTECDLIYVGGGDEFYLLQEFRRTGFDQVLLQKIAAGVPYVGSSAGSMLLGSSIEFSKSIRNHDASPLLESYDGLNLIPLSLFVHFDNPDLKEIYRTILEFALEDGTMFITLNDRQILYVEGDHWRIVESHVK
jgi:dipeptidase E